MFQCYDIVSHSNVLVYADNMLEKIEFWIQYAITTM